MTVSFDFENFPLRGGGLWKVKNSMLDDQQFCTEMLALIEQLLAVRHVFLSYREFWEIPKNDMKSLDISYSKCKSRAASHQKLFLTNHLIYLKDLLDGGDLSVKSDILGAELEGHIIIFFILKNGYTPETAVLIDNFDTAITVSLIINIIHKIRSRVKWLEEGEAPSAFFFKLENQKHRKHFTSSVWNL